MNEKKPKIYLAQLTEKNGKYGTFYSGMLGMTWVTLSQSKTPGKWNLFVEQKDDRDQPMKPNPSIGRPSASDADDTDIPF